MSAMKDYVTPMDRVNIFPKSNLKEKFILEELENIFYRRQNDDELQDQLEQSLKFLRSKRN